MPTSITPEPAQRLGDFEIVRELGRGGMGVVYEARQISLNRNVALKVLSAGLGLTEKAVGRFRREAEAAARLHHTNIVPVYATGEDKGIHYYPMELIDGPSLDHVIRGLRQGDAPLSGTPAAVPSSAASGPSAPTGPYIPAATGTPSSDSSTTTASGADHFDRIARMIAEVADGLEYARRQGVIHRDLKPSNLLLSPEGRLSINDFGLARVLEQPGMTLTGEFVGTPAYMSPEQITAGRAPLDHRTDIYSLGATLYELLTLQPPFSGERRDQVIAQIMHKEPRPPRSLNRHVPVDMETICVKAMEKDPDRRYQTAGALAEDLRRYVNRFAIQARRAGPLVRLRKWVRRHPGLAAGLAGMLILTVALGALAHRVQDLQRQRRADEERHEQELLAGKRQAAVEKAQLAAIGFQFDEADEALGEAERLGASTAEVRMLRGWIAYCADRILEAVQQLEQAVHLLPHSVAARAMLVVAYAHIGEWGKANQTLRELDELSPQSFEDYLFEGYAWQMIDPKKGLPLLEEAVRRRPSPLARMFRAEALFNWASETGTGADAERAVQEAEVARQLVPSRDNPEPTIIVLLARTTAAAAYAAAGDQDKRAQVLREARADVQTLKQMPHTPGAVLFRWLFLALVGEQESMAEECRQAIEQPGGAVIVFYYAAYLCERGERREALAILDAHRGAREAEDMRPFLLAELPGGKPLAIAACKDMAKKDWYGWEWAYGQSALSMLGQGEDLAAAAGDFRRRTNRFPVAETDQRLFRTLLDYWEGKAPDQALLDAARGSRRSQFRAHYFVGASKLGHGERAAACQEFRAAVDGGPVAFWTWHMSKIMLARLEKDPTWPPWIPTEK
jgi:serine/threonine protein kinase